MEENKLENIKENMKENNEKKEGKKEGKNKSKKGILNVKQAEKNDEGKKNAMGRNLRATALLFVLWLSYYAYSMPQSLAHFLHTDDVLWVEQGETQHIYAINTTQQEEIIALLGQYSYQRRADTYFGGRPQGEQGLTLRVERSGGQRTLVFYPEGVVVKNGLVFFMEEAFRLEEAILEIMTE